MKYEVLSHWDFGKNLLETGDLDPVYIGLNKLELLPEQLHQWLLSYWCFYHAGISCQISGLESVDFWHYLLFWASRPAAPRGIERRHFRGFAAQKAVHWLQETYISASEAIEDITKGATTFQQINSNVQNWPLFGPWIAFKVADMLERCAGIEIDFSNCELEMYSEPTKGALLIADLEDWDRNVKTVVDQLYIAYSSYKSPPTYDRPVGLQEIETIFCKFKSHYNGHYPLGKDTRELKEMLHGWGPLAERMIQACPTI